MKPIDSAIEDYYEGDWTDQKYTAFMLVELIGSETYRFTDAPIEVNWGGEVWSNVWFETSEFVVDSDGEVSASITFEDVTRTIRSLALAEDMNQFELKLYEVWADDSNEIFAQDLIIHGMCDGVACVGEDSEYPTATIAVTGRFAASAVGIGPTQEYTRNCRYERFKGPQCKYAGPVTFCDRLLSTCTMLENTINYGGFTMALEEGKTITWGTVGGTTVKRPVENYQPPPEEGGDVVPVTPNTGGRHRSARH